MKRPGTAPRQRPRVGEDAAAAGSGIPGLNQRVREAIYDHIFENDDHEVGGVLVGRLGTGLLPVVTGSIAALEAEGRRASVTFTHDAWSSIHATLERDFPDQQIVGWYHSHPGFGIFLSTHDRFIHDNFFSDQRQIAYVVDPHAGTEGVFHWRDGRLVLLAERPADRPGTEGRTTRLKLDAASTPRPSRPWRWYSILGGVLLLLLATAVVLLTRGSGPPRHQTANPPTIRSPAPAPGSSRAPVTGPGRSPGPTVSRPPGGALPADGALTDVTPAAAAAAAAQRAPAAATVPPAGGASGPTVSTPAHRPRSGG